MQHMQAFYSRIRPYRACQQASRKHKVRSQHKTCHYSKVTDKFLRRNEEGWIGIDKCRAEKLV